MADKIEHSQVDIAGGLNLHVAQLGKGELGSVMFVHGFPEIWYTWRHQMVAAAAAGFRAIAPDLRGYGLSSQPPDPEATTWDDLVADLLAILDHLSISKVFVVGKDFGAFIAYSLALQHQDRVKGVSTMGVPFVPPQGFQVDRELPEGFYISRWKEPDRAEADFGRFTVKQVIRTIYILFSKSEIPIAEEGQEVMDLVDLSTPLPEWFSEEDLTAYAALYENSGFRFPLHMPYRMLSKRSSVAEPKVAVPAMLIMGEKDYVFKFPEMEDYIRSEKVKHFVPYLEINYIQEGNHFVHEQFPEQVNQLLVAFLEKHI